MGHFATALIPRARGVDAPFWLFLVCANLLDFVWFGLALAGVEPTTPTSFLDVSIAGLHADMRYSHTLAYVVPFAVVVGVAADAWKRDARVARWCVALVVLHLLCDYVAGFEHPVAGPGSPSLGLGLYATAPEGAIVAEAVFAAACVAWYVRTRAAHGKQTSNKSLAMLYGAFVGGALFFLGTASHSMREWFERFT